MKNTYYWYSPRGFANEYQIIRCPNAAERMQLEAWAGDHVPEGARFGRVTVKELQKWAAEERHERKYNPAFAGYCEPWSPLTVDDFLRPEW